MLPINSLAYGQGTFIFRKQSLLQSKSFFDFSNVTEVNGFKISVTQPDGASIKVVFIVEDNLFIFDNNGNLIEYNHAGELADVLEYGNTVAQLLNVESVPEFVGKFVYILIGMDADINSEVLPKIKIQARVNSYNDFYNRTEYSPIYFLGENAKIIDCTAVKTIEGNATANISARLKDRFGDFGDWYNLDDLPFKQGSAIQYRIKYLVTTLDGTDSANVDEIKLRYSPDATSQVGYVTEIITSAVEFDSNLGEVAAIVCTDELEDCDLTAYVNFSGKSDFRENVILGVADGTEQVFNLAYNGILDRNVNQSSLSVMVDGIGFFDFEFNTQDSTIKLKAPAGKVVTASYECNLNDENWRELSKDFTKADGGNFVTRFYSDFSNREDKRVATTKFRLTKKNHVGQTPEIYNYAVGYAAQI